MDIQITSPYGVKLLTANTRLEEDITATIASSLLPSGELTVTENGTYDVYNKETVIVNVESSGGIIEVTELPTEDINTNAVYSMGGKLYRYEEQTASTTVAPTDLTGYTVTVPSGWTATAGYDYFLLGVEYDGVQASNFYIGYNLGDRGEPTRLANYVSIPYIVAIPNTEAFTLTFLDGSDTTNTSLIQWLTSNNATFSKSEYAWVEYSSGGENVADTVDKEITIGYTHSSSSSAYANVYTNFGEHYIQAGTSQTIRVVGILGISFDGVHKFINSDDGTINHFTHFDGIRYFAIKNTTNSISIVTDNSGGGSNN